MTATEKFPEPYFVKTNGIDMAVYEMGPKDGVPVILSHGWPELAYSWRHQLPALAKAGFRAIAPDQRGYGKTGGPKGEENVPLYSIKNLTNDMAGLLDALKLDKAIFCGHDWGGMVVWQMSLLHPERVAGVIGVNTPFIPRLTSDPIEAMRAAYGDDMYIVFFQKFGVAEKLLGEDTARSMRFFYRKRGITMSEWEKLPPEMKNFSFMDGLKAPEETWPGERLLTDEEYAVYTKAFEESGWEGGINWYRNFSRNWRETEGVEQKVNVPALMISAADDVVLSPAMTEGMEKYVPDLEKHIIQDCGHWTQSEKPDELNALMVEWLKRRYA
ncbi:alpha/beta fold hydrolase [Tepidicaulis sp. LMO-SS28]|uniref:alpha/beta fold hydrolase n=1 Tax=Tepidicaulis sp. LMO-SS28 TaxID=3447455 RepID=UPI003EE28C01